MLRTPAFAAGFLEIPILLPVHQCEDQGYHQGAALGGEGGQPQTRNSGHGGQHQHRADLENQGAHKGDGCGDGAVVQGGEEGGGEDVQSREEECQACLLYTSPSPRD